MRKFWLVTTNHLEEGIWFRDEEDFKVAMNFVAIQAASNPDVVVLAFILMSNHVHFMLYGCREDVLQFINAFKQRYSLYLRRKYGNKEFLRGNDVNLTLVPDENESLERAIAYVQMNCVAANICSNPTQYQWGTGNLFFNPSKPSGKPLVSISVRARNRLLHSKSDCVPMEWLFCEDGYILPHSYTAIQTVETLYRNPKRMNYFLNTSSKAKKRIESTDEHLPAFRDQTILSSLPDLYQSLFGKKTFGDLTSEEQIECVRQIRFRFSANVNQIARVCGISYAQAARLMEGL